MYSKITLYPLDQMTEPKGGIYKIYKDYFWIVDKDNNLLRYRDNTWQCNANKIIVEKLRDSCYPDCKIKQIPFVYTPWND